MGKSFARVANSATGVLIVGARAAGAAGVLALVALGAFAVCAPGAALALDSTGGTVAPAAVVSTSGTGGAVYTAVVPKPRTVKKPVRHAPARKPAKPKPKPPAPAVTPSGAPTPAQTAAQGAVFPVSGPHSFGGPENRFGAGRVGHIHQGQDVLASEGLPVLAPLAGTVIATGYQAGGAGWYVAEQASDGLSLLLRALRGGLGRRQAAKRACEPVSSSASSVRPATPPAPHLHFEIWVGGWRAAGGLPDRSAAVPGSLGPLRRAAERRPASVRTGG